jgi:hypothetical protein
MPLTPEQRTLRAKIAANTRWSREDPTENVKRANAGFQRRFLEQVDREFPGLPEAERQRRAQAGLRAYMAQLALKSSKARSRRGDAA